MQECNKEVQVSSTCLALVCFEEVAVALQLEVEVRNVRREQQHRDDAREPPARKTSLLCMQCIRHQSRRGDNSLHSMLAITARKQ